MQWGERELKPIRVQRAVQERSFVDNLRQFTASVRRGGLGSMKDSIAAVIVHALFYTEPEDRTALTNYIKQARPRRS